MAERARAELHARAVSCARALRLARSDDFRRAAGCVVGGGSGSAASQQQVGVLRAPRRRRGARARDGARSRSSWHFARGDVARCDGAAGGDARGQPRGATRSLARVPRAPDGAEQPAEGAHPRRPRARLAREVGARPAVLIDALLGTTGWFHLLGARPELLLAAVMVDLAFGDPVYPLHPIRLI